MALFHRVLRLWAAAPRIKKLARGGIVSNSKFSSHRSNRVESFENLLCNIFSLHNCKFDTMPTNEPDRSKCGLIPWLPWHPMPVNHLPTRDGKAQVRVESAWGPLDPSPSSPPCLGRGRFTRLPAPLTYALPTPPPTHDYPCLAHSYIHHRPYIYALLISMHAVSWVRGWWQSISNRDLDDLLSQWRYSFRSFDALDSSSTWQD